MAEPSTQEPADRDRLYACPIIDIRARSVFKDNLQHLCDVSTEERWARIFDRQEDAPELDPQVLNIFMELVADVEAWVVVERARGACKTKRGRNRRQ